MTYTLTYTLDQSVFPSLDAFKAAVSQVKSKQLTLNELQTSIDQQIIAFYTALYSHFNGSKLNNDDIIYRDNMLSFIESNYDEPLFWTFFSILKNNRLIGVCGRGFTFDYIPAIAPVKEDSAINTDIAEQSNNESQHEAEYFHIYNKTFPSYKDAFEYAIKHSITLSMIHSGRSPLSPERLKDIEWKYVNDRYKMSLEDTQDFLKHLESLPSSPDVERRIDHCKFMINLSKKRSAAEEEREKQFTYIVSKVDALLTKMKERGMINKKGLLYLNGECIYLMSSGGDIEDLYKDLLGLERKYFVQQTH